MQTSVKGSDYSTGQTVKTSSATIAAATTVPGTNREQLMIIILASTFTCVPALIVICCIVHHCCCSDDPKTVSKGHKGSEKPSHSSAGKDKQLNYEQSKKAAVIRSQQHVSKMTSSAEVGNSQSQMQVKKEKGVKNPSSTHKRPETETPDSVKSVTLSLNDTSTVSDERLLSSSDKSSHGIVAGYRRVNRVSPTKTAEKEDNCDTSAAVPHAKSYKQQNTDNISSNGKPTYSQTDAVTARITDNKNARSTSNMRTSTYAKTSSLASSVEHDADEDDEVHSSTIVHEPTRYNVALYPATDNVNGTNANTFIYLPNY